MLKHRLNEFHPLKLSQFNRLHKSIIHGQDIFIPNFYYVGNAYPY